MKKSGPFWHRYRATQIEKKLMDLHVKADAIAREIRIVQDELASHYGTAPVECGYEYVKPTNVIYLTDIAK